MVADVLRGSAFEGVGHAAMFQAPEGLTANNKLVVMLDPGGSLRQSRKIAQLRNSCCLRLPGDRRFVTERSFRAEGFT